MVINIDAVNPHWPRAVTVDTDQLLQNSEDDELEKILREIDEIENQQFSTVGPPGPPPRKGLEWREETHRWVRSQPLLPKDEDSEKPETEAELDRTPIPGEGTDENPWDWGDEGARTRYRWELFAQKPHPDWSEGTASESLGQIHSHHTSNTPRKASEWHRKPILDEDGNQVGVGMLNLDTDKISLESRFLNFLDAHETIEGDPYTDNIRRPAEYPSDTSSEYAYNIIKTLNDFFEHPNEDTADELYKAKLGGTSARDRGYNYLNSLAIDMGYGVQNSEYAWSELGQGIQNLIKDFDDESGVTYTSTPVSSDRKPAKASNVREFTTKLEMFNEYTEELLTIDLGILQDAYSLPNDMPYNIELTNMYVEGKLGNSQLSLEFAIRHDSGQLAGQMNRSINVNEEMIYQSTSPVEVQHESFFLNKDHQGKGIASALGEHLENAYREMGVGSIHLMADGDVGKYAWAVQGYDFIDDSLADESVKGIVRGFEGRLDQELSAKTSKLPDIPSNPVDVPPLGENLEWDWGFKVRWSDDNGGRLIGDDPPLDEDQMNKLFPVQGEETRGNLDENWAYVPFIPDESETYKPLTSDEIHDGRARYEHEVHAWEFKGTVTDNEGNEIKPRLLHDPRPDEINFISGWRLDIHGTPKASEVIDYSSESENLQKIPRVKGLSSIKPNRIQWQESDEEAESDLRDNLHHELWDFEHPWEFAQWNPFNEEDGNHFGKRAMLDRNNEFEIPSYSAVKHLQDESEPSYEMAKIYWEAKRKRQEGKFQNLLLQVPQEEETSDEDHPMNMTGENNDDLGDLTDPEFEKDILQAIREFMSDTPMSNRKLDRLIDSHLDEHEGLLEKQATDRATSSSAPGPPPRPGLTWKPQTHRWIRPGSSKEEEQKAPKGRGGEQWWRPNQEGDDRPILTVDGQRIPPAWTDLWINQDPNADRLAVGMDEAGRSQTTYSKEYGKKRSAIKFARIRSFAKGHSNLINQVTADVNAGNEEAIVASLINLSFIRPGSEKDTGAKQKAYGATTLLTDHVTVKGDEITLEFDSKKGGHTKRTITDKPLAEILEDRLQERQSGAQLFDTDAGKVNDYIQKTAIDIGMPGANNLRYTIKDFRTHGATSLALQEMSSGEYSMDPPPTAEQVQKKIDAVNKRRTVPPAIPDKKKKVKGKLETNDQFKERVSKAKERRSKWKQQEPLEGDGLRAEVLNQFELALNRTKKPIAEVVAEQLQNTPAMAIKSYMSPHIFEDWNNTYEDTARRVTSQMVGD